MPGATGLDEVCEFRALMQRVSEGSEDAAREVLAVYGPHVVRAVRRSLSRQMRPKFDSLDFAQAVWASFFADRRQLGELDRPEALVSLLVTVARNKVVDEFRRRYRSQRYDVRRERSLDPHPDSQAKQPFALLPSPSQAAIANELWERLLDGQSEISQEMLRMRRLGLTNEEVARRLGVHERTVRRVIQDLFEERY